MNFKVIIHALILIFIIHIIIINLDYEIDIGKKIEKFDNSKQKKTENKSLDFLLENKDDNEFINRMKEMSNSVEKKENLPDNKEIIPSNGYLNNENHPNFEANVEDVSKFYKIQNNYDNLDQNELQTTSLEDLKKKSENIITDIQKINPEGRVSEDKPNVWEYKNEFAMNGGSMNGIIGFDGLESQYAGFGSNLNLEENKQNFENIPHDDLRKPVVVN